LAYDPVLLERLRAITRSAYPTLEEKSMFGGFGYLINGNLAYGVSAQLIVRVGPENYQEALDQPHVRVMDLTGRPMRGWVFVDPPGIETDEQLQGWMQRGVNFAATLPSK